MIWTVNGVKFENLKIPPNLSFLCRPEYELFCFGILQDCIIHHSKHLEFFSNFFETSKCQISKKFKNRLHGARPPNRFSAWSSFYLVTFRYCHKAAIASGRLAFGLDFGHCPLAGAVLRTGNMNSLAWTDLFFYSRVFSSNKLTECSQGPPSLPFLASSTDKKDTRQFNKPALQVL
jgi:hypothetical protein